MVQNIACRDSCFIYLCPFLNESVRMGYNEQNERERLIPLPNDVGMYVQIKNIKVCEDKVIINIEAQRRIKLLDCFFVNSIQNVPVAKFEEYNDDNTEVESIINCRLKKKSNNNNNNNNDDDNDSSSDDDLTDKNNSNNNNNNNNNENNSINNSNSNNDADDENSSMDDINNNDIDINDNDNDNDSDSDSDSDDDSSSSSSDDDDDDDDEDNEIEDLRERFDEFSDNLYRLDQSKARRINDLTGESIELEDNYSNLTQYSYYIASLVYNAWMTNKEFLKEQYNFTIDSMWLSDIYLSQDPIQRLHSISRKIQECQYWYDK